MKKGLSFYWKLFSATFSLSAFTFGGGYIIIPLMRKKFVEQYHWIEEEEMMDLTAIAQSSPGAMAVNASILVGYRLAGIPGTLVTVLGTILPPLIILSIISIGYTAFRDSVAVSLVLRGMQAGVAAVIVDVVITMAKTICKGKRWIPIGIMIGAFFCACVLKINVVWIILVCGAFGALEVLWRGKKKKEETPCSTWNYSGVSFRSGCLASAEATRRCRLYSAKWLKCIHGSP